MKAAAVGNNSMLDTIHERVLVTIGVIVNGVFAGGWLKEHVKNRGVAQGRHSDELGAVRQELRQEIKDLKAEHGKELNDLKTELRDTRNELLNVRAELLDVRAENSALKLDFALQRERVFLMIQLAEMDDPAWKQIAQMLKQPHDVDELLAERRTAVKKDDATARILLVDDDEDILKTFKILLEIAGYQVDTAGNALDGLSLIVAANRASEPYSIAILDFMMGGMDGQEMAKAIESHNIGHTKIAVFTAHGEAKEALRKAGLGHIPILPKPIERDTFIGRIEKMLHDSEGERLH